MKKTIMMAVALTIIGTVSMKAQENDTRENIHFGAKVGLNISNIYDTQGENFTADNRAGFVTGVFMQVPIVKYFGIQPEILFSQKGFNAKGSMLGNRYDVSRTLNFLDLPVLVSFKPTEMFTILAGPQFSYLLSQNDVYADGGNNVSQVQEFNNDNLRKNTLCFLTGADINIKQFVFSGRVGWDLSNNNGDGTSTSPRYKNVWYQATIGFRL